MGEARWSLKRAQDTTTSEDSNANDGAVGHPAKKGRTAGELGSGQSPARQANLLDFTTDLLAYIVGKMDPGQQFVAAFVCKRLREACSRLPRHWTYYTQRGRMRIAGALRSALRTGSTRLLEWFEQSFGRSCINAVSWEFAGIDADADERLAIAEWRLKRKFGEWANGIAICDLMVAAARSVDVRLFEKLSAEYLKESDFMTAIDVIRVHEAMLSTAHVRFLEMESVLFESAYSSDNRIRFRLWEAGLGLRTAYSERLLGGAPTRCIFVPRNLLLYAAARLDKETITSLYRAAFNISSMTVAFEWHRGKVTAGEHLVECLIDSWASEGGLEDPAPLLWEIARFGKADTAEKLVKASRAAIRYEHLAYEAAKYSNTSVFLWACEKIELNGGRVEEIDLPLFSTVCTRQSHAEVVSEATQINFLGVVLRRYEFMPRELDAREAARHGRLEFLKWIITKNPSLAAPELLEKYFLLFLDGLSIRRHKEALERVFVQKGLLPPRKEPDRESGNESRAAAAAKAASPSVVHT